MIIRTISKIALSSSNTYAHIKIPTIIGWPLARCFDYAI